jgi:agmatinase
MSDSGAIHHPGPIGPVDASITPRFTGPATFARLPEPDAVSDVDIAIVGVPFDSGVSYRPGARFGPAHIRQSSKLLRPYNPAQDIEPFATQQVVDAGDIACNPFDIEETLKQIHEGALGLLERAGRLVSLGGDHTIALPLLRAVNERHGPVALVHFDAHLDTWDTYFGAPYTHGTPFRRASEEGLIDRTASVHVGIRGPLYGPLDLAQDRDLGFQVIPATELDAAGPAGVAEQVKTRTAGRPVYLSVDVDVLDPAAAPGTGTPEAGGLTSRELLTILRGLSGMNIVSMDVVEVSPPYDHAEITGIAAAHIVYETLSTMAPRPAPSPQHP